MEEKIEQEKKADPQIADLPTEPTTDKTDDVKGGAARRGGDDDDLEELEVQR
jgi:hypothetical protein